MKFLVERNGTNWVLTEQPPYANAFQTSNRTKPNPGSPSKVQGEVVTAAHAEFNADGIFVYGRVYLDAILNSIKVDPL